MNRSAKSQIWRPIVEEFLISGLSQAKFATQKGISSIQLSYWKDKIQREDSQVVTKVPAFIPVIERRRERITGTIDPVWLAKFLLAMHREER